MNTLDKMDFLNFNIYAMSNPSTPEEYLLVLNEALSEMDTLGDLIDSLGGEAE